MERNFDELNIKLKATPYEEYFGSMSLSKKQKQDRIDISESLEDVIRFIFQMFVIYASYEVVANTDYLINQIKSNYLRIAKEYIPSNVNEEKIIAYLNEYLDEFATNIVNTTIKHSDDEYYLSDDRAMYIAENEANTTLNYFDFEGAVASGKTKKKWIDVRDKKERETHLEVGGTVLPIDTAFLVGDSLMMFPKDESMGASAEEIINCRCSILYF